MGISKARKLLQGRDPGGPVLFDTPDHRGFLKHLTGRDCFDDMEGVVAEAVRRLDVDFLAFEIPATPKDKSSRENDPNLYGNDPTEWRHGESTANDIFNHDPLAKRPWLNATVDELARRFAEGDARSRRLAGGVALTHGFTFTTCLHYAAEDLNYEEFLCACALEPGRVPPLFDCYETHSANILNAWLRCNPELMVCHDDIASAKGLTLGRDFYREHLFPRYQRLFAPFIQNEIPLLYMTDGNFMDVAADLSAMGASGFFVDRPAMDLERLARLCGADKIYFTGPSPALMTRGSPGDVARDMKALASFARNVRGFMFHMPGGWPHNIPVENVKAYYSALGRL